MVAGIPRWGWVAALVLAVLAGILTALVQNNSAEADQAVFELEMMSSNPGKVQLFYDLGQGYNERDSQWALIGASDEFSLLHFVLPHGKYSHFRFDPLNGSGTFKLRNMRVLDARGKELRRFAARELRPFHDIAKLSTEGDVAVIQTLEKTVDPGTELILSPAVTVDDRPGTARAGATVLLSSLLVFAVAISGAGLLSRAGGDQLVLRLFDALAARSNPQFMIFDRVSLGFLALVTLVFGAMAAAGLHGSSFSIMAKTIPELSPPRGPLIGTAKAIRSDEWGYFTPAILYQLHRTNRLAVEDSMLGPGASALVSNLPTRHVSAFLRPQYLGFLVLPADTAFAVYWQMKAWLMVVGVFLLVKLFAQSSWGAVIGALWFYFGNFGQWWFSTPASMPEMAGSFGLTVVGACYLLIGRRTWLLLLVAVLTASCAVNFALCLYVPYLVPLTWLGVALVAAFVAARRKAIFSREKRFARCGALALCAAIIAAVMGKFYIDARLAIEALANTRYPGRRSLAGGTGNWAQYASHAMNLWESESRVPRGLANVCGAAGFYWFAPFIFMITALYRNFPADRLARYSAIAMTIVFCVLIAWSLFPIPATIGGLLFLNRTYNLSGIFALGIANIILTMQYMIHSPPAYFQGAARSPMRQISLLGVIFLAVLPTLGIVDGQYGYFWHAGEILLAACLVSALFFCLFTRRKWIFALLLLVPFVLRNSFVNPVDRGFPILDHSALAKLAEKPELREGRWLVYGTRIQSPAFFSSNGFQVFNGCKYTPDLNALSVLDPRKKFRDVFNQSAIFLATPLPAGQDPQFIPLDPFLIEMRVSPADPRLRQLHIRYIAFDEKPDPALVLAAGLKQLETLPVDGFWLFELPPAPAAGAAD